MGADFGGDGATSNIFALSSIVRIFLGVGALSLSSTAKYGGVVAFMILLAFATFVASWCIFKLVVCAETIQYCEAKLHMYKRKIKERLANNQPVPISVDDVKLFDEYPELGTDDDIEECDRGVLPLPTFKDIGSCSFGPWGGFVVDLSILITQLGGCVAYTIFIVGALHEVFPSVSRLVWILVFYIPFLCLTFIRDISKLAPAATAGNIVYIYTLFVLFYTGFKDHCCQPIEDLNLATYQEFPTIFGTLAFALEGIALVLPIKSRMAYPKSFGFVMTSAMCIIFLAYFFVGVFGYLFYGDATKSPVISNLSPGLMTDSVKIALCACLYFSFGLQVFPNSEFWDRMIDIHVFGLDFNLLRKTTTSAGDENGDDNEHAVPITTRLPALDSIDDLTGVEASAVLGDIPVQNPNQISNDDLVPAEYRVKRAILQNLQRVAYVTLCCGVALVFPQFHLIVALFGSLSNALLAYILPALFFIQICRFNVLDGTWYYPYNRDGSPNPYPVKSSEIGRLFNDESKFLNNNNNNNGEGETLIAPTDKTPLARNNRSGRHSPSHYDSATDDDVQSGLDSGNLFSQTTTTGTMTTKDLDLIATGSRHNKLRSDIPGSATGQDQPNTPYSDEYDPLFDEKPRPTIKLQATKLSIALLYAFPYFVAVLGSIASAIGVTMAVKDLVEEFGKAE